MWNNDDDYELPELNLVVGKVTFPQWQGNGGEVETSLSINYIHFRRDDNDEVDEYDEADDDGHAMVGKHEEELSFLGLSHKSMIPPGFRLFRTPKVTFLRKGRLF